MSSNQLGNIPARKSFAQVAAAANVSMKPREKKSPSPKPNTSAPKTPQVPSGMASPNTPKILERPADPVTSAGVPSIQTAAVTDGPNHVEHLSRLMDPSSLDIEAAPPSLDTLPSKPASDTKSITSRTTLTLDEKDSLRPDDSASMQAAVEDDAFSPSGSAVADSKQGSDPDSRAFRDQLNEIDRTGSRHVAAQRGIPVGKTTAADAPNGAILYAPNPPPESFPPPPAAILDGTRPALGEWNMPPDEKLVEALASPKDRLFVLKIEQDMIDFVKDSKEEYLQLPQTNSFYRMLSHKLADYYMLGHFIDDSMTSVRIFRTPNCRLPPPLIGPNPTVDGSTPPPNAPARKIMRRHRGDGKALDHVGGSDKNFDSLTSSKAPSDVGASSTPDEAKDATNGNAEKSALTREERENRYNEARARIFKDFEASENTEGINTQADKGISRTSSASGTKKTKKNRKPKDDGFEARSAFDQYGHRIVANEYPQPPQADQSYGPYASMGFQGQFPAGVPTFHPVQGAPMPNYNFQEGYGQPPYNPWSGQPPVHSYPQAHPAGMQESYNGQSYPPMTGYDSGQFSSGNIASQATPKGNALSLANYHQGYMPQNENSPWGQSSYPSQYSSTGYGYSEANGPNLGYYGSPGMSPAAAAPPSHFSAFPGQNGPYFGQAPPYTNFGNGHFNPRSQNFVPATRGAPLPGFSPDSNMAYPNSHIGFSGQPSMQRQPSNNSHGSGLNSMSLQQQQQQQHYLHNTNMRMNSNTQSQFRHQVTHNRGQAPSQSSIAKWSTPANLPAKPPPPAVMSPYVDVPRDPGNQQPLPPKPFSGVDRPPNNVKNLPIR